MANESSGIADEKYVVLTTRRKNGQTVPTAVWIARLPDGSMGFTTDLTSGKVKRIRNFADVTLQPSNMRGVVRPGTEPVAATASILTGTEVDPVETAILKKYGIPARLIGLGAAIRKLLKRNAPDERAAIRLVLSNDEA